jgi:hypothetical protein
MLILFCYFSKYFYLRLARCLLKDTEPVILSLDHRPSSGKASHAKDHRHHREVDPPRWCALKDA